MPRIRTLKPEHRQHRTVGPLSHRAYRLWVGMICEADDDGRLNADPDQLRVLIFGFHSKVSAKMVQQDLETLFTVGLVRLYDVDGIHYACFPNWKDHQRINRPTPSRLPSYQDSLKAHGALSEDSRRTHAGSEGIGKDRIGEDWKGRESEGRGTLGGSIPPNPPPLAHALSNTTNGNPNPASNEKTKPPRGEYDRLVNKAMFDNPKLTLSEAKEVALVEYNRQVNGL